MSKTDDTSIAGSAKPSIKSKEIRALRSLNFMLIRITRRSDIDCFDVEVWIYLEVGHFFDAYFTRRADIY